MQSYATADLGNIALETVENEPLIVDEGVIVEIVFPGTGEHVGPGEIGEILVTSLNLDYPLIRFATGDMSALHRKKVNVVVQILELLVGEVELIKQLK